MKKSRITKIYEIFFLLLIICIMGFNTYNCDMIAYENLYSRICNGQWPGGVEYGFILSLKIASKFNLTYRMYVFVVATLGGILLYRGIKFYTTNTALVLFFYIFFPFLLDVIQIRNFIVVAVFIFASRYLDFFSVKNLILYTLCILIAASFHNVAYIYLLFVFLYIKNERIFRKIIFIIYLLGFLFISTYDYFFELIAKLAPNIERYIQFGLDGTSGFTKIVFAGYLCFVTLIFSLIKKYYKKRNLDETYRTHFLIIKISQLANFFYFFMIFEADFYRVYRNLLVLYYIVWCEYIVKEKKIRVKGFVLVLAFVIMSFIMFIGMYTFDTVVVDVLSNNLIIENFIR